VTRGRNRIFRLVASDGWNAVSVPLREVPLTPDAVVVARSLGPRRRFADVPEGFLIEWRLEGERLANATRILDLPPNARGLLELVVRAEAGAEPIVDRVWIGS
jgi:hypothetical protein